LANLFFAAIPKDREYHQGVFEQLEKADASDDSVEKLINGITTANVLRDLSHQAYSVAEGKGNLEDVMKTYEQLKLLSSSSTDTTQVDVEFVTDDLEVLVNDSIKKHGLRWRLKTLNKMLGSLRKGDFGFLFARPETGKTTFLASEVTHMASQLNSESGPILWLNNEEQGSKVMLRLYQAALGIDLATLYSNIGKAKDEFHAVTHGKIKLYDSGTIHKRTVERLCEQFKPSLIIFDQIDKIQGFDSDREDLRLGTIYQWARELAKKYAAVIGVCQADGQGEGQRWLTMAHVANAKTAKQAEADWILGIGKVNDVGFDNIRYLHASKNKLTGDEDSDSTMRHGRMECLIEADIARYKDIG
jgi:replicative DNA helicase